MRMAPVAVSSLQRQLYHLDDAPSFSLNNYLLHLAWFLLCVGAQHWLKNAVNIYFCIDESLSWHYK